MSKLYSQKSFNFHVFLRNFQQKLLNQMWQNSPLYRFIVALFSFAMHHYPTTLISQCAHANSIKCAQFLQRAYPHTSPFLMLSQVRWCQLNQALAEISSLSLNSNFSTIHTCLKKNGGVLQVLHDIQMQSAIFFFNKFIICFSSTPTLRLII